MFLRAEDFGKYFDRFNENDEERYAQYYPNREAFSFLVNHVPLFECPDKHLEMIYYFRWWTYRKHIKHTPDGFVITEFLPEVSWSGKHNTINLASGMHVREGRWLRDAVYLDDYSRFWFRKGGHRKSYTSWLTHAIHSRMLVTGDSGLAIDLLEDMVQDFREWEKGFSYTHESEEYSIGGSSIGLFRTLDDRDGGEISIGGHGYRPYINAAMFGNAIAIAEIAQAAGRSEIADEFARKAETIKLLVQDKLWCKRSGFFMILHDRDLTLSDVRELYGYAPWLFHLPDPGYESCWREVMDPAGFHAPYGLTFAEQRHPEFRLSYTGHECQWNGPSWPMATSVVLTAMANLLNDYKQDAVNKRDYFDQLLIYARSQSIVLEDGRFVPWIDENLNPYTGDWISRTRLKEWDNGTWSERKGGRERGKDYNHSSFCDLVISGLVGLRPESKDGIRINPLIPENAWDWFCLEPIRYRGKDLTILWDRTGLKYKQGQGFHLYVDGQKTAWSKELREIIV